MMKKMLFAAALVATALTAPALAAPQQDAPAIETTVRLSRAEAKAALAALDQALDSYVEVDAAAKAKAVLKARHATYLAISERDAFAARLTTDVGQALGDKHFFVRSRTRPLPAPGGQGDDTVEAAEAYGIVTVRRLPGNIGYLDLSRFAVSSNASGRMEAAMDLVSNTKALIIDLRRNKGGGGPAMAALVGRLSSTPIPRSALIWRQGERFERTEAETRDYPAEQRYGGPVLLLTSGKTISAAEAFAYDLQASGRAKVVGEVTRGGANPMNRPLFDLGAGLSAYIATGRSEHPVTKSSPNGVGVQPDVATTAADAMAVAYTLALEGLTPEEAGGNEVVAAKADPAATLRSEP